MPAYRHANTPPNRHAAPVRKNASNPPNNHQKTAHRCANTKTAPESGETRENPVNATIPAHDAQTLINATVE